MLSSAEPAPIDPGRARRFACALTGNWRAGDILRQHVAEVYAVRRPVGDKISDTVAWFRAASEIWNSPAGELIEKLGAKDVNSLTGERRRVAAMPRQAREAFLLTTLGGLPIRKAALVVGRNLTEFKRQLEDVYSSEAEAAATSVMIIEDEAFIARDLEKIVQELGHRVSHKARTRDEAVIGIREVGADLVLADMQLLDGSSGIDAVNTIIGQTGALPVIFITAFPEQLIGGQRPGPTFLICKPFEPVEVRDAITQILYFGIKSSHASKSGTADGPPLVRFDK